MATEKTLEENFPTIDKSLLAEDNTNVELLDEVPVPDSLSAGDFDLSEELKKQKELQKGVSEQLTPTTLERGIQQQILGIREQADQVELGQKQDLLDLEREGIGTTVGFNIAEQDISKRDALKLETLQREQGNLLSRLGLEQDARELRLQGSEILLQQSEQNINTTLKIRDRIQQREDIVKSRERQMTETQRRNLNDFVSFLSGTNPADYDPQTQAEIARLAGETGIPFDAVMSRLQLDYDTRIADLGNGGDGISDFDKARNLFDPSISDDANLNNIREETELSISDAKRIVSEKQSKSSSTTTKEQQIFNAVQKVNEAGYTEEAARDKLASSLADSNGIKLSSDESPFKQLEDLIPSTAKLIDDAVWLKYNPDDSKKGGFLGIGGTKREEIEKQFGTQESPVIDSPEADVAKQFIIDNPDLTDEELTEGIFVNTGLSLSDIQKIVDQK